MSVETATEVKPYKEYSTAPKLYRTKSIAFDIDELYNLIDFIEVEFIDTIRRDENIDNIDYVVTMMNVLKKLRVAHDCLKRQEEEEETDD